MGKGVVRINGMRRRRKETTVRNTSGNLNVRLWSPVTHERRGHWSGSVLRVSFSASSSSIDHVRTLTLALSALATDCDRGAVRGLPVCRSRQRPPGDGENGRRTAAEPVLQHV